MRRTIRERAAATEHPGGNPRVDQLTTTARRRSAESSKLLHQLKGDLDWIVMKCLEKDRQRRYDTANGLAADLQRHLDNEPVTARPPSAIYRFQKAFRRNRIAFVAATAIVATLLLGIVASTWQSVRATRAMQQAQSAEAHATEQRERAQVSEKNALAAQSSERKLRQQAEGAELAARQRAYASDMNVARQALTGEQPGSRAGSAEPPTARARPKGFARLGWRYLWKQTRSDAAFTLYQEPAGITSLTASPDGRWLAVGSHHKDGLAVWDLQMRQELFRLATNEANVRAAFSTTEPLLAITGMAFRWTVGPGPAAALEPCPEKDGGRTPAGQRLPRPGVLPGWAHACDLHGGGTYHALAGSQRGEARELPSEQSGGSQNHGFATTPDLGIAAFAMSEGRIRAIDLHSGKELWTVRAAKEFVTALAFSPDGRTLASAAGYTESNIRLWKVDTGKQITQLDGHGSWVGDWCSGRMARNWPPAVPPTRRFERGISRVKMPRRPAGSSVGGVARGLAARRQDAGERRQGRHDLHLGHLPDT